METREKILIELRKLIGHNLEFIEILERGNAAIWSALQAVEKEVLVPEEGGWLTYLDYPPKLNLNLVKVKTKNAVIDLDDLEEKSKTADAFLYHSLGGYFAEEPIKEIYDICKRNDCLVIMDVSGSIGTRLCNGNYADILFGSFGRWKLVNAHTGGFISCKNKLLFEKIKPSFKMLEEEKLKIVLNKINELEDRILFLFNQREKIVADLRKFEIINKNHPSFVVVARFNDEPEKEKIVGYCKKNNWEFTECPRYIRTNQQAISIEVKRLE
ncbi:MAG: DegT/DnrJ/EryC1/StrS family aminotransferase [Candidatus Woesearchaeota archaeon]